MKQKGKSAKDEIEEKKRHKMWQGCYKNGYLYRETTFLSKVSAFPFFLPQFFYSPIFPGDQKSNETFLSTLHNHFKFPYRREIKRGKEAYEILTRKASVSCIKLHS